MAAVAVVLSELDLALLAVVVLGLVVFAFIGGMHIGMGTPEACDLCQQSGCTGACRKGGYR